MRASRKMAILEVVRRAGEPLTTRTVADAVGCSARSAWDDLRRLERDGLVGHDRGSQAAFWWIDDTEGP